MDHVLQLIGSLQKKYSIGAFELLSKMAPIQVVSLLVFGPFIYYYLSTNLIFDYIKTITSGAIVSNNQNLIYPSITYYIYIYI